MNNKLKGYLIILSSIILIVACTSKETKKETKRPVKLFVVNDHSKADKYTYSGVIKEWDEVKLAFRIAGPISKIFVKQGQFVKQGEILAQMDSRDYELQYNAVKADYEQVLSEVARIEQLYKKGNIPDNDYEKAISGRDQMQVKYNATKNALNDTRLFAPFDGYVQTVYMSENEIVDAGTLIISLVDVSKLIVETEIPDNLYLKRNTFKSYGFTILSKPDEYFNLNYLGLSAKANTNNLYKIRFEHIPQKSNKLAPGMSVNVHIQTKSDNEIEVKAPSTSVFYSNDSTFVWIYKNGQVFKQNVEVGLIDWQSNINITKGLKISDSIVSAGVNSLKNEQLVNYIKE